MASQVYGVRRGVEVHDWPHEIGKPLRPRGGGFGALNAGDGGLAGAAVGAVLMDTGSTRSVCGDIFPVDMSLPLLTAIAGLVV